MQDNEPTPPGADAVKRDVTTLKAGDRTGRIPDEKIVALVKTHFDLRPKGIIQMLDLLRPIYLKTAAYGHFGRDEPEFTWEAMDKVQALQAAAGLPGTTASPGSGSRVQSVALETTQK